MSEAKFTKGEWHSEIYSSGNQAYVWAADGTGILANQSIGGTDDRIAEHHANAHLIAAAPEMYEMLKLISDLSLLEHDKGLSESAEKLLAKARGEV